MNIALSYVYLIKSHVIKQMRSYSFLIVIGMSIFIGYASVPSVNAGYEVFYIGGIRGIYNSAWLGGMVAMFSTLLLWLFGFYLLRSQISEDDRLQVGQIIAATPICNFRYLFSKGLSNFIVLLVIELIMIFAFMTMQLIRGESYQLQIADYFLPFLFIVLPSLFVLASLTILFDVVPGLKGVIGNIVFFGLWIFFSVISIASPNSIVDLYGLDAIRSDMVEEAKVKYSFLEISEEGGSFGYYPIEGEISTFIWEGVHWQPNLLGQRLVWVLIALCIVLISSMIFKRFQNDSVKRSRERETHFQAERKFNFRTELQQGFQFSPVVNEPKLKLFRVVWAECRLMLKGYSVWWYLLLIGSILVSFFCSLESLRKWLPFIFVLPIAIWSQLATRERQYFTRELILSSGSPVLRAIAVWIAGVSITFLVSSGVMVRFLLDGQFPLFYSWLIGVFFIPTLGYSLGLVSGSRKLFEVFFMLWWYLGPVNGIPYLDFLGISNSYNKLYLFLTVSLMAMSILIHLLQTNKVGFRKKIISKRGII
ncbi:hypothetical protein [Alkalihalobacterium bogoriense]|uniref:hypothetical protein n=1 Tax=Alkalihalobacterium bogoriense TaxID=246272 RepID=UPI00054EA25D|nr:hypothetical protein [Alkalihalobacterium bogoriense]